MKKIVAVLAALVFAVPAMAQVAMLSEGTQELQLSGGVDFDTLADTRLDLGVGYAKFLRDNWEVGVEAGFQDDEFAMFWELGVFTEYNFDMGTEMVPYVGAGIYGGGGEIEETNESNEAAVGQVSAGLKYFLRPNLALFGEFAYRQASDDLYPEEDGEISDSEITLDWGIRFFFE